MLNHQSFETSEKSNNHLSKKMSTNLTTSRRFFLQNRIEFKPKNNRFFSIKLLNYLLVLIVLIILPKMSDSAGSPGSAAISIFSSNYLRRSGNINNVNNNNNNPVNFIRPAVSSNSQFDLKLNRNKLNSNQSLTQNTNRNCPPECSCQGLSIDCSNRQLTQIPKNIPKNVIKVELQGNLLTIIKSTELSYLKNLKVLHLQDNQIEFIEPNSLDNLFALERLRLNNNKLSYLPNDLFVYLKSLKRLDLSYNKLKSINKIQLSSLNNLNNLQLDNNEIKCIEKSSLDSLNKLDIFRFHNNKFECNCKILWLSEWLRKNPHLAHETKCFMPDKSRDYDIIRLNQKDLNCQIQENDDKCELENLCPFPCLCENGIIDCKDKMLTELPKNLPKSAVELHLKRNLITEIPSEAFASLTKLKLLDLSNNLIQKLHTDSFKGLSALNTLILFRNEIKYLPTLIFNESPNLQFLLLFNNRLAYLDNKLLTNLTDLKTLLLNANKLTCLKKETFSGLENLNLLSLYDNQLKTLPNGLFEPLRSVQTIHLGRNPLLCDCKLKWLNEYFRSKPVERSGISCSLPKRLAKKSIGTIANAKFRCGANSTVEHANDSCDLVGPGECPKGCTCENRIVNCSSRRLIEIPKNIPENSIELLLENNLIKEVKSNGVFKRLKNLKKINLINNLIEKIEDDAFDGAEFLHELFLNENKLTALRPKMFSGLPNLNTLLIRANKVAHLKNDTFDLTPNLHLLSLYGNGIKCIQSGSFDKLKSLTALNIMNNPLMCNCGLKWLKDWLKKSSLASGTPKCVNFKDQSITSVEDREFICAANFKDECGSANNMSPQPIQNPTVVLNQVEKLECPKNCSCSNLGKLVVRCSHLSLKKLPDDMIKSVQELYLDTNELIEIPSQIKTFTNLEKLDLSFNRIRTIPGRIFENLKKLNTLILSYNNIQCIHVDSFIGLKKLKMLNFHANDLSTIPNGAFTDLISLTQIAVGINPLYCDCNLAWLSAWIQNNYLESAIARCHGPPSLANRLILTTPTQDFKCNNETSVIENRCDVCFQHSCANNSTCEAKEPGGYQCVCPPGFHGEKCEQVIDACYGQPCKNQGVCQVLMEGRYKCECKKGWEGYHCEINIDECKSNPCMNNATCVDMPGSFNCSCSKDFMGTLCEEKIDWCSKAELSPCKNSGKCVKLSSSVGYKCECAVGFSGDLCQVNLDDCINHKCQFGTCVDGVGNYTCKCKDGFSGAYCEIMNPIAMPLVANQKQSVQKVEQVIGCTSNDCLNEGICYKLAINGQLETKSRCKCQLGYSGEKCEILNMVNFQYEDSYIELESPDLENTLNLTLTVITEAENGILFYHGSKAKQHMAVELFKGRIRISFDVGNTPVSTMFSYAKINDKKEHTIQFLITGQNFTLRINETNEQRTISNQGTFQYLNIGDEPLYVGGVPNSIKERISKQLMHVVDSTSFKGCLFNLHHNQQLKNLQQVEYSHKIFAGCAAMDACSKNLDTLSKCQNGGVCKPIFTLNLDFTCVCAKEFTGQLCEKPAVEMAEHRALPLVNNYNSNGQKSLLKSGEINEKVSLKPNGEIMVNNCGEKVVHEFYTDLKTGCKSRKKVKTVKCRGDCSKETKEQPISAALQSSPGSFDFIIGTNRKQPNQRSIVQADQCCRPAKSKPKKIKLYCENGSTIMVDVYLPKKCVCVNKCSTNAMKS